MEEKKNNSISESEASVTAEKAKKTKKLKRLKNQALLKRGGFSVAITAAVLAGVIVLNILIGVLADRFVLEFDLSSQKINSINEENVEYIKSVDKDVKVTVCADKDTYAEYMSYYSQQYNVSEDASDYYKQTVSLIERYGQYNDKISVEFVDTQSTEFTEISTKYANINLNYGDLIVSCTDDDGNERYRIVGFNSIYALSEDSTYSDYGYTFNTVSGNNVETALTSAIAYVTSGDLKKMAVLTGHSSNDYTDDYRALLETNNYEIDMIEDSIITEISSEYDAIMIAAPTKDFIESELDAIAQFLDNGGKLGKGLLYFADSNAPYLSNWSDFLAEWGIAVEEGILFETDSRYHIPEEPTTMATYSTGNDDITSVVSNYCISGYNVGLTTLFDKEDNITVTSLMSTSDSVVNAPIGTSNSWTGAEDYEKASYSSIIQSVKEDYNDDSEKVSSYVFAFGSIELIFSDYCNMSGVSNQDITLAAAERAVGAENTGISFTSKTITNESYLDSISESSAKSVLAIFVIIIPIACIVAGIYIYIRRRNS